MPLELLSIPFFLQGILMTVDEFYFHRHRDLPKWERLGHPCDTLTVLVCFGLLMAEPPSTGSLKLYTALAIFSCLFVTKDEWVHKKECTGGEVWVHSLLFILHPLVFMGAGLIWFYNRHSLTWIVSFQFWLVLLFLIYQTLTWNFLWKKKS